jgi:hypothetical protein
MTCYAPKIEDKSEYLQISTPIPYSLFLFFTTQIDKLNYLGPQLIVFVTLLD